MPALAAQSAPLARPATSRMQVTLAFNAQPTASPAPPPLPAPPASPTSTSQLPAPPRTAQLLVLPAARPALHQAPQASAAHATTSFTLYLQ